jgi:hypothetical protein
MKYDVLCLSQVLIYLFRANENRKTREIGALDKQPNAKRKVVILTLVQN